MSEIPLLYVLNGVEIHDIIDLLCVVPPTEYHKANTISKDAEYVNWLTPKRLYWVEASIDFQTKRLIRIACHPDITRYKYVREGKEARIETLLDWVIAWCITGKNIPDLRVEYRSSL